MRAQLRFGILKSRSIQPCDVPVDGHFLPNQQPYAIGQTHHLFVIGIVCEPDEIAAQLLRPLQQRPILFFGDNTSTTEGRFLMQGNSAQKHRLPIENDLRASCLDGAKTELILYGIRAGGDDDTVELWVFR